jgi:hypothetical protein
MPARLWPPTDGDAASVHELSLVRDVADPGTHDSDFSAPELALAGLPSAPPAPLRTLESAAAGTRRTWEAERREKAVGGR